MNSLLAQVSRLDDQIFRGLVIPIGLVIVYFGWRAIQRREFVVNRHVPPIRGVMAVVLGCGVIVIGAAASLVSLASFFR
ncbi:hypothetical protein [Planctomicrobium sp. SH527]|uniref:hypothetical protein n=1 Tax=Planctomicrobium sp. SH527 TaxID=3448123 RepID=UPI003F5AF3AE